MINTSVHVYVNCLYIPVVNTFQACVPYFEILEKWIYKGRINDPYSEVKLNLDSQQ